ncbi:MAG: serine O-acetyltransferase [Candidatus Poseidoniales archaeon]|tara:strand:- start:58 stop:723 length:666 start_codon:yes stop_codon:yes gene_type:complete
MSAYKIWKLGNKHRRKGNKIAANIIKWFLRIVYHQDISLSVRIGENAIFSHGGIGTVITSRASIGDNCTVGANVVIGNIHLSSERGPNIGNNVFIGSGAKILGPVTIGNNVNIGANALVITDIESGITCIGVPAKPTQKKLFVIDSIRGEKFKGKVSDHLRNIFSEKGYDLSLDAKYVFYDNSDNKKRHGNAIDETFIIESDNIYYKVKKYANKLTIYIKY